jgi:hypothetical protein
MAMARAFQVTVVGEGTLAVRVDEPVTFGGLNAVIKGMFGLDRDEMKRLELRGVDTQPRRTRHCTRSRRTATSQARST